MTKKIRLIFLAVVAIMLGLWVWTFSIQRDYLSIGGSASVDLILQRSTGIYQNQKHGSLIFSSTGSQAGMNNMLQDVYDIGFLSRDLKKKEYEDYKFKNDEEYFKANNFDQEKYFQNVENEASKYHKLTFAKDALVLVYNPVEGFDERFQEKLIIEIENTKSEQYFTPEEIIRPIFSAKDTNHRLKWNELAQLIADKYPEANLKEAALKVKALPIESYTLDPGSGTRSSFEKSMGNIPIGIANNTYSNNGSIFYQIAQSKGSIGYVSQSYAQNLKISDYAYLKSITIAVKTKKYNPNINPTRAGDIDVDLKDYPLKRPFNAVFKNQDDKEKLRKITNFLYWLGTNPDLDEAFIKEGLDRPLEKKGGK
ncbi:phosphate ABC transporter substrate-binding protein [Williamsoniiplasma luminosum]|uniref:Phosphate ABC transporter substrate-binding protein n=1 Tax=Williamsoniiplasma luminosum TaxID=214888 RepID=A0A2S0NL74_9MOLU|nr:phosphate ABC transporter substrate-binding protein [Williamsoniiplasma luminosum]AVP49752.1 MAG: phosphate ABC transporter substrate-binding protein [Williamsoniiplasma luminosum]